MDDPNKVQYGGDHYRKAGNLQHWDMVADLGGGWEYYVARATAYLTRIKDEDLDPKKAVHFIDKLLALIEQRRVPPVFESTQSKRRGFDNRYGTPSTTMVDVDEYLRSYYTANSLSADSDEAEGIALLVKAVTVADLKRARIVVARFAGLPQLDEPDPNPGGG